MDLRSLLLEGLWYLQDGVLKVQNKDGEDIVVFDALEPLLNTEVLITMHHFPPNPPDMTKWGGGCCHWENTGNCPAGHQDRPDKIFTLSCEGVLVKDAENWYCEKEQERSPLPFHLLEGHDARLVMITSFKKSLFEIPTTPNAISEMETQIVNLRGMLAQLQNEFKKGS
jgi:hypothetical protein